MRRRCIVWIVIVSLCLCPLTSHAEPGDEDWQPGLHDISAMVLIAGAQDALAQLESEQKPSQRKIFLTSALSSLSALHQLHGFETAMERLLLLYNDPDCPDIHFGYSNDGRVRLTVEPLELKNPVFSEYTVMLITIESNCGELIRAESIGSLGVELPDGVLVLPDQLSPEHELWENIKRLADTFEPPLFIDPGSSSAFQIRWIPVLPDSPVKN